VKHSHKLLTLALLGLLVLTATVMAEVPGLMNYQGLLSDAGGTPVADDTYEVTFRIYDEVPTERWSEVHNVTTTGGLFSVQLGSNGTPLEPAHFDYAETWLGIQITGESEMTPRQRLTAVPYALASGSGGEWKRYSNPPYGDYLSPVNNDHRVAIGKDGGGPYRLDVISSIDPAIGGLRVSMRPMVEGDATNAYFVVDAHLNEDAVGLHVNARGKSGTITGILAQTTGFENQWAGRFESRLGVFKTSNPTGDTLVVLEPTSVGGGALTTWGPLNSRNVRLTHMTLNPDYGAMLVFNDNNEVRAQTYIDGLADFGAFWTLGPNQSSNVLIGANNANYNKGFIDVFDETGTSQVQIFVDEPDGDGIVVADQLILNENTYGDLSAILPDNSVNSAEILNEAGIASEQTTNSTLLSTVMQDLETVTITIPADGYILVQGKCYLRTEGVTTSNLCSFQIDQTTGGSRVFPYATRAGVGSSPTTGSNYFPIFTSRIYLKNAGEHTFILEGMRDQATGTATAFHKIVTALYFPTGYGIVEAISENLGDLPGATPVTAMAGEEPGDNKTMYKLDLRELEVRAARTRAAAMEAERDLLKAQMQAGGPTSHQID
jgi:hypothetical protein